MGGAGGARRRLRRGIDATTAAQLVVLAVVWVFGASLVALVADLLRPWTGVPASVAVVAWTATGLLVFVRPVEVVLGRLLLGLHAPGPAQAAVLGDAWAHVCAAAGVPADRYLLRVQRSGYLNAAAGAGHLVGVTTTALGLQPRQLEAVLAHELGHHLAGHAMIGLLHGWYSWPLRLLVRLCGLVSRAASVAMMVSRSCSPLLVLALLPLTLLSCVGVVLVPLVAVPVVISTVVTRRSELRADRTAVRLGYGSDLLGLYRWFAAREGPPPGVVRSISAFLRDSHPRFDIRVRALETALGVQAVE